MRKENTVAIITGLFSLAVGIIGALGAASVIDNNNSVSVYFNGEQVSLDKYEAQKLNDSYDELTNEFTELSNQNTVFQKEIDRLKKENDDLLSDNETLLSENNTLYGRIASLESSDKAENPHTDTKINSTSWENASNMLDIAPAYQYNYYSEYFNTSTDFSIMGEKYKNGCAWGTYYGAYSLHSLNGLYSEITGIIGHIDKTPMSNAILQIIYDGVLHDEISLSGDMIAYQLTLDVSGVNQLQFKMNEVYTYGQYGFADIKIK